MYVYLCIFDCLGPYLHEVSSVILCICNPHSCYLIMFIASSVIDFSIRLYVILYIVIFEGYIDHVSYL